MERGDTGLGRDAYGQARRRGNPRGRPAARSGQEGAGNQVYPRPGDTAGQTGIREGETEEDYGQFMRRPGQAPPRSPRFRTGRARMRQPGRYPPPDGEQPGDRNRPGWQPGASGPGANGPGANRPGASRPGYGPGDLDGDVPGPRWSRGPGGQDQAGYGPVAGGGQANGANPGVRPQPGASQQTASQQTASQQHVSRQSAGQQGAGPRNYGQQAGGRGSAWQADPPYQNGWQPDRGLGGDRGPADRGLGDRSQGGDRGPAGRGLGSGSVPGQAQVPGPGPAGRRYPPRGDRRFAPYGDPRFAPGVNRRYGPADGRRYGPADGRRMPPGVDPRFAAGAGIRYPGADALWVSPPADPRYRPPGGLAQPDGVPSDAFDGGRPAGAGPCAGPGAGYWGGGSPNGLPPTSARPRPQTRPGQPDGGRLANGRPVIGAKVIRQQDSAEARRRIGGSQAIAAIAPDGLEAFARDLRALRAKAELDYPDMAERSHYTMKTLAAAAGGLRLPTLPVTIAYVSACEGDVGEWEDRWHKLADKLNAEAAKKPRNDRDEDEAADAAEPGEQADGAAQVPEPPPGNQQPGEVFIITSAKPRHPGW